MSSDLRVGNRRFSAPTVLALLAALIALVALLAPEDVDQEAGNSSSRSTAPSGARMAYELAERMGWRASRRDTPLESSDGHTVQVVLTPEQPLGAEEVHRLLENVRRGGGLIFEVIGGGEIKDSIGLVSGPPRTNQSQAPDTSCTVRSRGVVSRTSAAINVTMPLFEITSYQVKWRRPPPGILTPIIGANGPHASDTVGVAFHMGAGRVVVLTTNQLFWNYSIRACEYGADLAVANTFQYLRPNGFARPQIVFDEFHHGYGAHGGSIGAVSRYLAHTASGHFLEQALLAALILLMAHAPRAILPRDPERIPRRSPLEHADALAHAYSDVEATRTATSRLVSGIRRRVGRTVPIAAAVDDATFLDAVVRRTPALAPSVEIVRRGLSENLTPRQFAAIADAVLDIERQLSTTPPKSS